jgi:ubiquitin carboxyl-terminal hydrolase L3
MNLPDGALKEDSPLMKFKKESLKLERELSLARVTLRAEADPSASARAKLLDEADFFEAAHTSAAQHGQSAVPEDLDVDTHFIAFIEGINGKG